jgi:hypothetical protein
LLISHYHMGKPVECPMYGDHWEECDPNWRDNIYYRVKPTREIQVGDMVYIKDSGFTHKVIAIHQEDERRFIVVAHKGDKPKVRWYEEAELADDEMSYD